MWDRIQALIHLSTMFFALPGRVERQIFYPGNLILLLLEIFIRSSGDADLLTGAGKVDAAATRSWLIMRKMSAGSDRLLTS